ncbi:thioredoxin-disulfide reductase [bacterium 1XD42-94]|nr:thioredoxin-disulfide reductase [bacterium 1XD42-76]NBK06064.1 thioredoxin-disulfide reductase [bacterium 1XD42-94]
METIYDLVIIGSGPAGLGAAIYAQRAELKTLVIEKEMVSGGQVLTTYEVDNYAGLPGINGFELGMKFKEHADKLGTEFAVDTVLSVKTAEPAGELMKAAELSAGIREVVCEGHTYKARTVLIASGARHRKLDVPGEERLTGMGVSYCATCDGAFFRKKTAAVVGGGDVAIEDAIFLARLCEKVYLIHRRDELRGARSLQKKLMELENVELVWDTVVEAINGDDKVSSIDLLNKKTGEKRTLSVDGVFIAVGISPNTGAYEGLVEMDAGGYIVAGEDGKTSAAGIFAAGDVRTKALRQIVTAVADGANCITSVEEYLNAQ